MPRVDSKYDRADVTLVTLVYRSLKWLKWCMESVDDSVQTTRYRWLVVANDATEEVRNSPWVDVDWRNEDPDEYYIPRVYRAWHEGMLQARTQNVILLNNDMFASDHAIDELVAAKKADPKALPCGLLVESGRIPSGMPEYVRNFGLTPGTFHRAGFLRYADSIRKPGQTEPGRLFQPVLFDRQDYFGFDGYPQGNVAGISGDRILFDRFTRGGFKWVTCMGSVWAHLMLGEQSDEA